MATRTSRAPLIPLNDPNKGVNGELILQVEESIPHLLYKGEDIGLVDLIRMCIDPMFNQLAEEVKERYITSTIQPTTPTNGEQIWFKTEIFDEILTDDEQM